MVLTLLAAATLGLVYWFPIRRWFDRWGATSQELKRAMAGDVMISNPSKIATSAITIAAPPAAIWPWLVQIGQQRGGLYSYDWLDRLMGFLDRPSADSVIPEFQHLTVGETIHWGRVDLAVASLEPLRALVLRIVPSTKALGMDWVWQFGLYPLDETRTRLVSRSTERVPHTLLSWLFMRIAEPGAFVMGRRMLLGIKQRAEALQASRLAGDDLLPGARAQATHHINIEAPPAKVWPWLVQMGCHRGGWYSWDLLDNGGVPSANRVVPALQQLAVGDILPLTRRGPDRVAVLILDAPHALVLGTRSILGGGPGASDSGPRATWAFSLEPVGDAASKLVVRVRAEYGATWMADWVVRPTVRLVHDFMERKQLRTLKRRAETVLAA